MAVAILALTVGGCRESRQQPPKAAVAQADPLAMAREAMARRDYGAAVTLLTDAVARRPEDLEVHYRLGVSASQLDRVDDAGREFEWVVAHGQPDAAEVRIARDWLASRPSDKTPEPTGTIVAQEAPPEERAELAVLSGRTVSPEGVRSRLQLFLKGLPGSPVKDEYHLLRTDQEGSFRFINVVPGDYMLTDAAAGPATWRLKVSLRRGERRVLDLSPANDVRARDDFPEASS